MKEGWEYKKLKDVALYSIGLTYKPSDVNEEGTIVLRSSNIQNDKLDLNDIVKVSCPIKESLYVQKDDILMCSRNGSAKLVGKVALIPEIKERMTYGTFMMVIRSVYNPYLFYYFKSENFRNQIKHGEANMINQITRYMLDDVYLYVPPLSEQQRIVDYLGSAFAKIDAMKANAEKALNEAKALFQASLKEMLEPKEGWEEKKVGDISEIKGGKRLPKGEKLQSEPTSHKYIRVADFNEYGTVNLDDILYISDNVYEHIKRYIIKKEDIYISIAGTIGKSGIIPEELDGANLTENACRLILSKEINQRFMYYITISPEFIRQEIESTKISAQPKLALTRLSDIIITYPPLSEQQSIVATLDSLKSKVDRLQSNFEKISQECDALKQAILRQVFE